MVAPLYGVIGVLAALHQREQTGIGQHIDIGMLDSMASIVASEHFDAIAHCGFPLRTGNVMSRMAPFGVFQAMDGYVAICAHTDAYCRGVFAAMERPELMQDERFAVKNIRIMHSSDLNPLVDDWTRTLTVAEVIEKLGAQKVPCSPVNSPEAALADPHVVYRKAVVPLPHPTLADPEHAVGAGMPIKFSESSCDYDVPAPLLGQHNHEVFRELLGLTAEEISALEKGGTI